MRGKFALEISFAELSIVSAGGQPAMDIAMLDCPEQSHTSPRRTFRSVIVESPSETETSYGPPALTVLSFTNHEPSSRTTVDPRLFHEETTWIFFPPPAFPQTRTSRCCCKTTLSV